MSGVESVERILVIELWNIGDVVLTLPFLGQLRARFPGSTTTLLARPHARELLEGTGLVHEFIEADLGWKNANRGFSPLSYNWRELLRVLPRLRRGKFDLGFQARAHVREYVLLGLSTAKRRVGFRLRGWDRLLTDAIAVETQGQKKDDWNRLLAPFGGSSAVKEPHLRVSEEERRLARAFLRSGGGAAGPLVVGVHPGASIPEKRWPLDRFEEVVRRLVARGDLTVLAFTEPGGYGASLGLIEGVVSARVELREMMALIESCDLLVCNDSGPMHIAAALGVPTVAIFSAGISRVFAPLGAGHVLLTPDTQSQTPAGGHPSLPYDVSGVPVARVLEAVERSLETAASNAAKREQARILLSRGEVIPSTQ